MQREIGVPGDRPVRTPGAGLGILRFRDRPADRSNVRRLWIYWLALASLLTLAYFLVPESPTSKLVLYNGTGLIAILAVHVGRRVNSTPDRSPWVWFGRGLTSFLIADVYYYAYELVTHHQPDFPSVADLFYLMTYPMLIIGLMKLVRTTMSERDQSSVIDAAIVGLATGAGMWILFVYSMFKSGSHSPAALATQLAYPVMDVALVTVAARLVIKLHLRHPPYALILSAVLTLSIADIAYGVANSNGTFHTGSYIDAFWLSFYVLFGAAALHPSNSSDAPRVKSVNNRLNGRQIIIVLLATLSVRTVDLIWGNDHTRIVSIVTTTVMFILILTRVYGLTKALENSRDQMHHDTTHDPLTGLANRTMFAELTELALSGDRRKPVAVLFIDLDDFKTVNDTLGHQAGDRLLTELAERLRGVTRSADTIARIGGDEFAVLIVSGIDDADISAMAQQIIRTINLPVDLGLREVRTGCSIGIAIAGSRTASSEMLLRNADTAMYLSKKTGKGRVHVFDDHMHNDVEKRLDLKADLRTACDLDQIGVLYRPILDPSSRRVVSIEAVPRWNHPRFGPLDAALFTPLAEESEIILDIGRRVLAEACKHVRPGDSSKDMTMSRSG